MLIFWHGVNQYTAGAQPAGTADHGYPLSAGKGVGFRGPGCTLLRVLEEKGHVKRRAEGLKYVYTPTVAQEKAKRTAVKHLLDTYFNGSPEQIVAALLDVSSTRLTRQELDRMTEMIDRAKKEGK